jgi:hypothetical protein
MARYRHDDRITHPGFPQIRDRAMPEIMKPKILDPRLATRLDEGRFNGRHSLTFEGKHISTAQSPGYPLKQTY